MKLRPRSWYAAAVTLFGRLLWWWSLWTEMLRGMRHRPPALASSIEPPSDDERRALEGAARCIACGTCDRSFDGWPNVPRDRFFGPMTFVLRARSREAWPALGPMISAMERARLAELTALCPMHVPFVSLVRVVRGKVPPPAPRPPRKSKVIHDPG